MCEFEKKVKDSLIECGVNLKGRLGLAVSGGADSISLLLALSNLFSSLYVITVNHNIRPPQESRGDVDFVLQVCEKLRRGSDCEIICDVVELERGAVAAEAKKRGGGIEEAARHLRYAAFNEFIKKRRLEALCLAHNKNDQLETLLMRFLQGSPAEAAAGIRAKRESFVRPLLGVSRREIEEYVTGRGFTWRTDKSNYETDYLRNKIRLKLVPFLDENFSGWQNAVLNGAEKSRQDAELIKLLSPQIELTFSEDGCVNIPLKSIEEAPEALKYRILIEAVNKAGEVSRIPHQFLKDVAASLSAASFSKHFAGIDIIKEKNKLFVKKHNKDNTDLVFFDIIENIGEYEFPFGTLIVSNIEEYEGKSFASISISDEKVELPFCIRSVQLDDTTLSADGAERKVSDILSDWHVPLEKRAFVPVIQILNDKSQRINYIFAGFLGYKDWIVKL